ncbi:MAG: phosphatase PAP2 family protein [Bacteroidaceae bacterium]|nr:phosphatase PAP2 family protein [Bacteroidaceae bacterium]
MVIDFFKREEGKTQFLAVESLNLIYNLLTTLLIIIFFNSLQNPQEMLMGRFFIAAGTFTVIYLYTLYPSPLTRYLRIASQMALLAYWYPDTFEFNRIFPNLDHLFATAEFSIFGCQPAILFEQVCSHPLWREAFNMGYWAYYPMIFTMVTWYFFKQARDVERCTFVIMASFFIYYFIYMFVPVAGPQFYFPVIGDAVAAAGPYPAIGDYFNLNPEITIPQANKGGFFTSLVNAAQESGERPTAAFPSSHIGISTILMLLARRSHKGLMFTLLPFYLLLCCATVYIKAHYLIDGIAGVASGVAIYALTTYLYKKTA